MAKILTIDNCFINNNKDEEQRLILESALDSIKEDVKTVNQDNYEEERFNEKCISYIDEIKNVYLKLSNLGEDETSRINEFKICLIQKNKFYQISRDKMVSYSEERIHWSNQEVKFYMTKEHKAEYLEILTEKLKKYYNRIKHNSLNNRAYREKGKPYLELIKAKEFVREAFNESYKDAENSYKPKLDEHNKKEGLRRSREKVIKRNNKDYVPKFKEVVLLSKEALKKLSYNSQKRIIDNFEAKKTQTGYE